MAEINVQRRQSSAWVWVLASVGVIALLWALFRGFDREPEMLPGTPGVRLLDDPQDFAVADVMSPVSPRRSSDRSATRA